MVRRILAAGVLTAALLVSGTTPAQAADTQAFHGEGSSSFGPKIAYDYALADALGQAADAGYTSADCHVTNTVDFWPIAVYVDLECTR